MGLYIRANEPPKKVNKLLVDVNGAAEVKIGYTGREANSSLNKVYEGFNKDTEFTKVNPVKLLTSGKITSEDIGKTIYLSNSTIACQEWRVADVNHDGTSGTVDLFPKYTLTTSYMAFGSNQIYADSSLRTWLNGAVLGGFTAEIQNAMKVQNFPSNGVTLSDKVKCPSLDEVGCNNSQGYCIVEGAIYPIFGAQQLRPNNLAIYHRPDNGEAAYYWTRSRFTYYSKYVWYVYNDVYCGSSYYSFSNDVVACIRF